MKTSVLSLVSSRTLGFVAILAILVGVYALIPTWLEYQENPTFMDTPSQFHAGLSLVLGWLLVFRTNTAYNRWWEARTLWGALVNTSRNLAIKTRIVGSIAVEDQERLRRLIVNFPDALRLHLRGETESVLPGELVELRQGRKHIPQELARQIYCILTSSKASGAIDGDELRVLDEESRRLMDICGACERILKTRIVRSYRVFARQCVILFLATLPWGIVHDFRIWTIPITIVSAYFMLGLETVAEHVEEPFGYDEDDLDLEGLCYTIRTSVNEVFEHTK